jgi:hypothetical protein
MRVLREGKRNRMVAYLSSRMTDIDLKEPAGKQRLIASGEPLVEAARDIGISFGISFGDA